MERTLIMGAGLAGSLLSLYLAQRGYEVQVAEARPDMRKDLVDAGRSINLALSCRGIHALEQVGLKDAIMDLAIPMRGRMIHDRDGQLELQPYGQRTDEVIHSISRAELNIRLLDAAEATGQVSIFFETRCMGLNLPERTLYLRRDDTGQEWAVGVERVFGCDGAGSPVRLSMIKHPDFKYDPQFIAHGYKELTIPPGPGGTHQIDANALHIWPRGSFMLIALPNLDGSFTCTLFLPNEGPTDSFAALDTEEAVRAFFAAHFADAVPLMPDLVNDFFENPTGPLGMIKCQPWHYQDTAVILGDAAHAMVPFYGQGMNAAFEDCFFLDQYLGEFEGDWKRTFAAFSRRRKPHADAIADLAMRNFIEMRDSVADPTYVLKREVALALERRHPDTFIPLYSMISFHRIPYAEAQRRGAIQAEILTTLTDALDHLDALDWAAADRLVTERLDPIETMA